MKRHKKVRVLDRVDVGYGWEFAVAVNGHTYKVKLHEDYWANITGGQAEPEELVQAAFGFLLDRERPEQILKEFWLKQINTYFEDFESKIGEYLG